jgi:hypothetical protein
MKINFPVTLTAADNRKRTISGTIVTWGERGNTSAGATVFEKGSIDFSKPVKLLLEHDRTRPIGKLMDITADDAGIEATFKIAGTIAGDDSLLEAAQNNLTKFDHVGFTEDYVNSVARLGLFGEQPSHLNSSKEFSMPNDVKFANFLADITKYDEKLYEFALARAFSQ